MVSHVEGHNRHLVRHGGIELHYDPGSRQDALGLQKDKRLGLHDVLQEIAKIRQVVRVEEDFVAASFDWLLIDDGLELHLH